MDPTALNKYLYIEKTPTWRVRIVYIVSILAWALLLYGFSSAVLYIPFYRWAVSPLLLFFSLYYFSSYGLNLFYRQYDIEKHEALIKKYWHKKAEPSVDVFLPICGEDLSVLQNTWKHVSRMKYQNLKVYVLDDSRTECEEHKQIAESYGFTYLERPEKGWMKKAGNLKYAYERSNGEFINIFDADFAPHPDFLHDILPYMDDPKVGIVQSPQYFETTYEVYKRSPLEYGAAQVQEAFYRYIQVARSRFGGTICCGSNAIYRREALNKIGGPVLAEHSEDARTGFEVTAHGYRVLYVPIILAIGLCPSDAHAYFHQQHRWGSGSMTLFLSRRFWQSPVDWKTKVCYGVGFLFYMSQPLSILFSFQLFYGLFFYNQYITLAAGLLFYPATVSGFIIIFFFPIARFRPGVFRAMMLQTYSYSHAVFCAFLKSTVGWIPTNAKHIGVSKPFKQVTLAVSIYVLVYLSLVALTIRTGIFHLFNYNYYTVQFWLLYNIVLSGTLLWHLYRTMERAQAQQITNGTSARASLRAWQLKTAGIYIALSVGMFFFLVYS